MPDFIHPIDQPPYCEVCGADESEGCDCDDGYDEAERLDREEEERTCIGPDCLNPHYDHWRWECFTAESAAADFENGGRDFDDAR